MKHILITHVKNTCWKHMLKTHVKTHGENKCCKHMLKTHVEDTCWKHAENTCWKHILKILIRNTIFRTNIGLNIIKNAHWKQNFGNTYWKNILKTNFEKILKTHLKILKTLIEKAIYNTHIENSIFNTHIEKTIYNTHVEKTIFKTPSNQPHLLNKYQINTGFSYLVELESYLV